MMRLTILLCTALVLLFMSGAMGAEVLEPKAQSDCEDDGGKWSVSEQTSKGECNLPTLDAGKICNDSSDCESACIAESSMLPGIETTGICYGWSLLQSDCVNPVSSGITQGSTCDD